MPHILYTKILMAPTRQNTKGKAVITVNPLSFTTFSGAGLNTTYKSTYIHTYSTYVRMYILTVSTYVCTYILTYLSL